MEPEHTVLDSLRNAVNAMPEDVPLRLHLATLLLGAGQRDEAVRHLGAVLQRDPGNAQALSLLTDPGLPSEPGAAAGPPRPDPLALSPERSGVMPPRPATAADQDAGQNGKPPRYDWTAAEDELRDVLPAMFVGEGDGDSASAGIDEADAYDAEHTGLKLADLRPG
jgi:hypothetical protein